MINHSLCIRRHSSKLMSSWTTVFITIERLLAVVCPLKVSSWSTIHRARFVLALGVFTCIGLGSFPLWTVAFGCYNGNCDETRCVVSNVDVYLAWAFPVYVGGTLLVPTIAMIVMSSVIIGTVITRTRRLAKQV